MTQPDDLDLVVGNGTVLTMDPEGTVFEAGFVGIRNGKIIAVGPGKDNDRPSKRVLDARGGLILPGLVNGHTHAAMALFRGLADDLPLMRWLNDYIFPVERRLDADFVFAGTSLACAEMIRSGTTTFCDMYLFEEFVARAARRAGMRCLVGEVLYDFPSPNYGSPEQGLAYTDELIGRWGGDRLVSVMVEPHAPYTCSPDLLTAANELALRRGVMLGLHLCESRTEIEEIQKRYGKSPVAHLDALGLLGSHLKVDHAVHVDAEEIRVLADRGVKAVHNPESNMKLAAGIAPVPELIAAGVTVGLGTDGCASNNNLDLLAEMDTAAKLHKVARRDPTEMKADTVLRMATIEGARALGLDDRIGSLEAGKCADLIVLDTHKPHLTPLYNPISQIVYSAAGGDVRLSLIHI